MWQAYGLFLAQTLTIFILMASFLILIVTLIHRSKLQTLESVEIKHLNKKYDRMRTTLLQHTLSKAALKIERKRQKRELKRREQEKDAAPKLFVLKFKGDLSASQVNGLREEVTAILMVAKTNDEVLLHLESPGGTVHGYGFAASQLQRFRERSIKLTVSVDKVAASGGYMMACVADQIIAAPFAYIGSIGVLVQFPNFHRLLDQHQIDFEQVKAGNLKRTLTMFGKNTDADREKVQQELEVIHQQFKDFIVLHRPKIAIDQVATGEVWLAHNAKTFGLIDELITGDDYLLRAAETRELYTVCFQGKKGFGERIRQQAKALIVDPVLAFLQHPYA